MQVLGGGGSARGCYLVFFEAADKKNIDAQCARRRETLGVCVPVRKPAFDMYLHFIYGRVVGAGSLEPPPPPRPRARARANDAAHKASLRTRIIRNVDHHLTP